MLPRGVAALRSSVLWVCALVCGGCATAPASSHEPVPEWIARVPQTGQEICAVGVSGPTYYPEDAKAYSQAAAKTELGRAVEVKVTSAMTMQSEGDSRGSSTTVRETAGFASEKVLKQAKVREQWVSSGEDPRYGVVGTVYTLACLPFGQ